MAWLPVCYSAVGRAVGRRERDGIGIPGATTADCLNAGQDAGCDVGTSHAIKEYQRILKAGRAGMQGFSREEKSCAPARSDISPSPA